MSNRKRIDPGTELELIDDVELVELVEEIARTAQPRVQPPPIPPDARRSSRRG